MTRSQEQAKARWARYYQKHKDRYRLQRRQREQRRYGESDREVLTPFSVIAKDLGITPDGAQKAFVAALRKLWRNRVSANANQ
jgi:hypothetical protein